MALSWDCSFSALLCRFQTRLRTQRSFIFLSNHKCGERSASTSISSIPLGGDEKVLSSFFPISFLESRECLLHNFFNALFQTVVLRLEFKVFTLEGHVCCDYGCDARVLLFYFVLSTLPLSFVPVKSFAKSIFSFAI